MSPRLQSMRRVSKECELGENVNGRIPREKSTAQCIKYTRGCINQMIAYLSVLPRGHMRLRDKIYTPSLIYGEFNGYTDSPDYLAHLRYTRQKQGKCTILFSPPRWNIRFSFSKKNVGMKKRNITNSLCLLSV